MIGHWQKRNGKAMANYHPANLDRKLFQDLALRYGGKLVTDKLDGHGEGWGIDGTHEDPDALDDWSRCGIERAEDIRDCLVPNFYFGCEADDPINALALDGRYHVYSSDMATPF